MTLEQIKQMSPKKFKILVKEKVENTALENLILTQKSMKKGVEISYKNIKCQTYLLPESCLSYEDQCLLFSLRTKCITKH